MKYKYNTTGTCSSTITFEIENNIVKNVNFIGGCPGNLQAIAKLVDNMSVDEINEKLSGIKCGFKQTSCADQLAKAVLEARKKNE